MRSLAYLKTENLVIKSWPTKKMTESEFEALKESIRKSGILTPILVTPSLENTNDKKKFEVLEGRHRLKAAIECGIEEIPCIVFDIWNDGDVLCAAVYDSEIYRKSYTEEEKIQYLQQKETEEKKTQERIVSIFANLSMSSEQIEKLTGSSRVNSAARMLKLISVIDSQNVQKIKDLERELEQYKEKLFQKEESEKALKEKLAQAQAALENIKTKYKEHFESKLAEKVQEELEKELARRRELKQDTSEETIARIKKELEREIRVQLEEEYRRQIEEKERDIDELNQNLQEVTKKLKELKNEFDRLNEESRRKIQALEEENKFYSTNINITTNEVRQLRKTIERISTPQVLIKNINYIAQLLDNTYELAVGASEIGFDKVELENTKIAISNLKSKVEKLLKFVSSQTPWDENLNVETKSDANAA